MSGGMFEGLFCGFRGEGDDYQKFGAADDILHGHEVNDGVVCGLTFLHGHHSDSAGIVITVRVMTYIVDGGSPRE